MTKTRFIITVTCTNKPHVQHHYYGESVEQVKSDWGKLSGYAPHQFRVELDPHPEWQLGSFQREPFNA